MKINLFDRRRVYGMSGRKRTGADARSCGSDKMTHTPEKAAFSGEDAASPPRRRPLAATTGTEALPGLSLGLAHVLFPRLPGHLSTPFPLIPARLGTPSIP